MAIRPATVVEWSAREIAVRLSRQITACGTLRPQSPALHARNCLRPAGGTGRVRPFQLTARRHAREYDARYARTGQVAGAQPAILADELQHSLV